VIQAALKSGSMVTARYGVEHDREVYTIPASPWDERYSGNLKLIEEGAYQIMDLDLIHI
jgi:DNA processing protein